MIGQQNLYTCLCSCVYAYHTFYDRLQGLLVVVVIGIIIIVVAAVCDGYTQVVDQ